LAGKTLPGSYFKTALFVVAVWAGLLLTNGCSTASLGLPAADKAATGAGDETALPELQPNPELSPEDVVKIQVEALQQNDDNDSGIEVTFRFASPANKQVTGPLFRFKELVKNPLYRPMLNHKTADYSKMVFDGDTATQRVTIIESNGEATVYLFTLSRQNLSDCPGCWMTDSVSVVPTRKQDLQGI
jgi:hypothetical protein